MKAILHFAICIFTMCILCGCSQAYRWSQSHPSYNKAPTDSIAVTGLDEAFVVTRSSWFAKKLEISKNLEMISICLNSPVIKNGYYGS